MIFSKTWLKAALIRAVKTFAQTAASLMALEMSTIFDIDWRYVIGASTLSFLFSIATSVAGLPEVEEPEDKGGDDN